MKPHNINYHSNYADYQIRAYARLLIFTIIFCCYNSHAQNAENRIFENKLYKFTLNENYLNEVTPNFLASALASGAHFVRLAIRVSFDGCVLKNSGVVLPFLAFIRFHNSTASSGLYPACYRIISNPILSASDSWLLLNGNITPRVVLIPYTALNF